MVSVFIIDFFESRRDFRHVLQTGTKSFVLLSVAFLVPSLPAHRDLILLSDVTADATISVYGLRPPLLTSMKGRVSLALNLFVSRIPFFSIYELDRNHFP